MASDNPTIKTIRKDAVLTQLESGIISLIDAARLMKFSEEDISEAIRLMNLKVGEKADKASKEFVAQCYLNLGQVMASQSLVRDAFFTFGEVHITNLILGKIPATVALVDDETKMLYIPMPKCGSSTVKNYFTQAKYNEYYGELVHFRRHEMYRIVKFDELNGKYKGYFKFCVLRDPLERVASYYMMNVLDGSLKREARGRSHFLSLETLPGALSMAQNFQIYRQVFMDFRHHTDPMRGYLPEDLSVLSSVYSMHDIPVVKSKIEERFSTKISDRKSMVGKEVSITKEECLKRIQGIKMHYNDDYKMLSSI